MGGHGGLLLLLLLLLLPAPINGFHLISFSKHSSATNRAPNDNGEMDRLRGGEHHIGSRALNCETLRHQHRITQIFEYSRILFINGF